jgi:hypothetical protein
VDAMLILGFVVAAPFGLWLGLQLAKILGDVKGFFLVVVPGFLFFLYILLS